MDYIKLTLALILTTMLSLAESRTHFPGRFPSSPFIQQNTLSPLGSNNDRSESMKDWIKITPTDRLLTVRRGERLVIDCEAIGSPSPRLQWYKGARPVTQMMEEDNDIRGFGLAKVVRTFIADCAVPAHEGTYTCSAVAGGESDVTEPIRIIVEGDKRSDECRPSPPKIILWAPIVMQTMTSNVQIPCRVHGASSVIWVARDGQIVTNVIGSRLKVLESGDLVISKLKWADMGTYTCFAENELGKDTVSTFLYPMLNED